MTNTRQTYAGIRSESTLVALIGLKRAAFMELCASFGTHWHTYISVHTLDGKVRKRRPTQKKHDVLPTDADKLYFILKYLKNNPLQEAIAHDFGIPQPHANLWIHALLPVLRQTLISMRYAPSREGSQLSAILEQYDFVLLDVSERRIERPEDAKEQEASYSGKKKAHTVKNAIITAPNKAVLFASTTVEGSVHDKALTDDAALELSSLVVVLADSGFQGFEAGEATILIPCKKPPGKEHPKHHKDWNKALAKVRVKVEHAIANIKTFRMVKDTIRLRKASLRDMVFEISCGLANLRLNTQVSK